MRLLLACATVLVTAVGCAPPTTEVDEPSCTTGCDALTGEGVGALYVEDGVLRFDPLMPNGFSVRSIDLTVSAKGKAPSTFKIDLGQVNDLGSFVDADYPLTVVAQVWLDTSNYQLVGAQLADGLRYSLSVASADAIPKDAPRVLPSPFDTWAVRFHGVATLKLGDVHPDDYAAALTTGWTIGGQKSLAIMYSSVPAVWPGKTVAVTFVIGTTTKHLIGGLMTQIGDAAVKIGRYTIDGPGDIMIDDGVFRAPKPGELTSP
jgi:hypothetical protein